MDGPATGTMVDRQKMQLFQGLFLRVFSESLRLVSLGCSVRREDYSSLGKIRASNQSNRSYSSAPRVKSYLANR